MEVIHYTEGSIEPTLQPNQIYLYSMRFCPYSHRVHLILNTLQILYEPIFINLISKPKWYLDKFPSGRVPALLHENEFIYESLLLADYINEKFSNNSLYPRELVKKYKDKILIENFSEAISAFQQMTKVEFKSENFNKLIDKIQEYEKELVTRGTSYFGGDKPLMIDFMIWPWFERVDLLAILYPESDSKIPYEKIPNLTKWISLMKNDEAVKKHYIPAQIHAKYVQLRKQKDPGAFNITI